MNSRIHKKQLSILDNIASLTDHELREALKRYDQAPGPITESTRNLYRKKLASLAENADEISPKKRTSDDEETSDEDFVVQDEDFEEEESDEDEEEDLDEDEEGELLNDLSQDITLSSSEGYSVIRRSQSASSHMRSKIIFSLITFFFAILALYLYSGDSKGFTSLPIHKSFKTLALYTVIIAVLSPIVYGLYKLIRFYNQNRSHQAQKVCDFVADALELLQSPENPKGMMPVLHIRDTLITPSERNSKKMMHLWNKSVKFIEEHESRVKVEIVNIDGEDFRAWKWIGSRK